MVNNKNKASVSRAASSHCEATGMSHPPAGFTVTRRWDRQLRAFAAQVSCPDHFHLKLVITSQKVLPADGLGSHLVASDPFCHPFSPIRLTHLSTHPRWVMTLASWQYHWAYFFSFTGSCYKRSIPKLYMEWFSFSWLFLSKFWLTISLGLLRWLGQNLFPLVAWLTSEWA